MSAQRFTLPRTGAAPLAFTGELLAEAKSAPEDGPKGRIRAHEARVYRTTMFTLIIEIAYRSTWPDETPRSIVHMASNAKGVATALADHDPCAPIVGYPNGAQFAERQRRLLAHHRAAWQALVSELLTQLPGSAEEVP